MLKRLALSLALLFCLASGASAAGCAGTGNCYWIGGSGNASSTTNWATTNGGAVTGSVPTSADNCNFTALSNTTAYTVTVDATTNCANMTWALPAVSGVPTLAGASALNIFGSLTNVSTMLWTYTGVLTFSATSTGNTITNASVSYANSWTFSGSGGGWTLQDTLTLPANKVLTFTNGNLNTNAQTVSVGQFNSVSGTRTLTITNSTINLTESTNSITVWNTNNTITLNASGSTINYTGSGLNPTFVFTALVYGQLTITASGNTSITSMPTSFSGFSYTNGANKTDTLVFSANMTIASSGAVSLTGNTVTNRPLIKSSVLGTTRTITVSGSPTITLTDVDIQDITASGSTPWTGTSLGDALGNSGITFDVSAAQTYQGGTGNWSTAANWTSRVPLPQDDVTLDTTGAAGTLTADMPRMGRSITSTLWNKTLSFASTPNTIFGNIALGASGTYSGTQALTLAGRGSQTITSAGKTFPQAITVAAFGGTYTQQDGLTNTTTFTLNNGTWADGGNTFSGTTFVSSGALARALNCSGIWSLSAISGTIWNVAATLTMTAAPSQIKLTGTNSTTATFAGAGLTYGTLYWSNTTSTGTLIITGANTFAALQSDNTTARTWQFPHGVTQVIGPNGWEITGKPGVVITIDSDSSGSSATLQSAGGYPNSSDYLSLKDIDAVGGSGWFAGNHSTNTSNNIGWNFYAPISAAAEMAARRH